MSDKPPEEARKHVLKTKYSIVTIHDVSPQYTQKIFTMANELERQSIPFNFALIPCHNEEKSNDLRNNIELVTKVKDYNQDIALHGLFHEHEGDLEEFRQLTREEARDEIKKAIELFSQIGIRTDVFLPPTWTINKDTIDALLDLHFNIVETDQELIILSKNTRLATSILNWDAGSQMLNRLYRDINKRLFRRKIMGNTEMVRIALHPKDPIEALAEQCELIHSLQELNYNFLKYSNIEKVFG
jgi:predicted deacetylase